MAEAAIGGAGQGAQIVGVDAITNEGSKHTRGCFGIIASGQCGDIVGRELRPVLRQIEAAVGREPCQRDGAEVEWRRGAPGRMIQHGGWR